MRDDNRYSVKALSSWADPEGETGDPDPRLKNHKNIGFPIAPDKDSRQLGIYPPLFGLIGYFKF